MHTAKFHDGYITCLNYVTIFGEMHLLSRLKWGLIEEQAAREN